MRYSLSFAAILSLPLFVGCGKSAGGVPVSGRITRDGQPLANAQIVFQGVGADGKPDADKEAGGETDDKGQYTLLRAKDQAKAVAPGDYHVEIHVIERTPDGIRELVPPQYSTNSQLKFTVPPGGTKDANFDVKSK